MPFLGGRLRERKDLEDGSDSGHDLKATVLPDQRPDAEAQALLQRHFEDTFGPIDLVPCEEKESRESKSRDNASDKDNESEWSGIDEADYQDDPARSGVEVVSYAADQEVDVDGLGPLLTRKYDKSFMTSRPPTITVDSSTIDGANGISKSKNGKNDQSEDNDDAAETANIENDFALQRLLRESHLLESQSPLSYGGRSRHKAFDLRLRDLGSKTSIYDQANMPMSQRKGIQAKASEREVIRRREARENGVILERPASKSRSKSAAGLASSATRNMQKRQRGVGGPSIGKFKGGLLTLSKQDVANIHGPTSKRRKGGKAGKR